MIYMNRLGEISNGTRNDAAGIHVSDSEEPQTGAQTGSTAERPGEVPQEVITVQGSVLSKVIVILGSESDRSLLDDSKALEFFREVGMPFELSYISAHRHATELTKYCVKKVENGTEVFIAAAGMAAALPGAVAAAIDGRCPVIGVALPSPEFMDAMDALLAITRMPPGVPVLCAGIGKAGLKNAAIAACQIVGLGDPDVCKKTRDWILQNKKPPRYDVSTICLKERI